MDLRLAEKMAKELIAKYCPDYTFKFDNAKLRHGQCNYQKKTISLSRINARVNGIEEVRDTILHEIAHALTPRMKHGPEWRRKAIEIGANGKRCSKSKNIDMDHAKYLLVCNVCNNTYPRYRKPKRSVACGECCRKYANNKYDERFNLIVRSNQK